MITCIIATNLFYFASSNFHLFEFLMCVFFYFSTWYSRSGCDIDCCPGGPLSPPVGLYSLFFLSSLPGPCRHTGIIPCWLPGAPVHSAAGDLGQSQLLSSGRHGHLCASGSAVLRQVGRWSQKDSLCTVFSSAGIFSFSQGREGSAYLVTPPQLSKHQSQELKGHSGGQVQPLPQEVLGRLQVRWSWISLSL